jgi:hypothetical protein
MALSTVEVEYITLSMAILEVVWLRKLLTDLFDHEMDPTVIHCVGTGVDPRFNTSTTHQQNPNYWPFHQHLQSR